MRSRSLFILAIALVWGLSVVPARAVVSVDPRLARELQARGALQPVLHRLREARDRGFFDLPFMESSKLVAATTTWNALVILVDFTDHPQSDNYDAATWDNYLFSENAPSTDSFTDIYLDNSYGDFLITGQVVGWYRMPHPYSYYCNGDGIEGTSDDYGLGDYPQNAQGLAEDAVDAADPDVDYHDFLNNRWGVDGVFVVHAGLGAEQTANVDDIWSHQATIYHDTLDGVTVRSYIAEPELSEGGGITKVGIFAHEFGHVLGLPDLYDLDGSSLGVGRWSLMSGGTWNDGGAHPSDFDAWSKVQLGFLTPVEMTVEGDSLILPPVETSPTVYKLHTAAMGTQEYFLIENRQAIHNDAYLPGAGMLIWHVDEAVATNRDETCLADGSAHPLLRLVQADGRCDLEGKVGSDDGDPFPGSAGNRLLDSVSSPDSRAYAGTSSDVALKRIGVNGPGIYFDLRFTAVLSILVPDVYATLGEALVAAGAGDEVRIREGFLSTGSYALTPGVHLSGGWNADYSAQNPDNPSVIEGTPSAGLLSLNGTSTGWTRLDHLLLRNGGGGIHRLSPEDGHFGGALYVDAGWLQVDSCRFENNAAGDSSENVARGGAIAAFSSQVEITKCSFSNNHAQEAADLYLFGGDVSVSSTAFEGGALYDAIPLSEKRGGSILSENASLSLGACSFQSYANAYDGGAVYVDGGSAILRQCVLDGNSVAAEGHGGITLAGAEGIWRNNIFVSNTPDAAGGTLAGSFDGDYNLYWDNGSGDPVNGIATGVHDLQADPFFVDSTAGDFHLGAGSLAIDGGDPAEPVDFDGSLADLGLYGGAWDEGLRPSVLISAVAQPNATGGTLLSWQNGSQGTLALSVDVYVRSRLGSSVASFLASTTGNTYVDSASPSTHEYLVQAVDGEGRAGSWGTWFRVETTASTSPAARFRVGQPYPNPFNPSTQLSFSLGHAMRVRVEVLNAAGRRVANLADGIFAAGEHVARWRGMDHRGRPVASGVYQLRVVSEEGSAVRRVLLLK